MTVPTPTPKFPRHVLVAIGGPLNGLGSFTEQWCCNLRCIGANAGWSADPDTQLAALVTPLQTWWTTAANYMSPQAKLGFLKLNNINADGTYAEPVTHQHLYASQPAGGASSSLVPPFLSVRFSWTTAAARGIASKGGIYPPVGLPATITSGITTTDQTNITTAAKAFLTVMATTPSGGVPPALIPSVVSAGKVHRDGTRDAGISHAITGVRVGNVIDVQRRRKAQLAESYMALGFP